MSKAFTKDEDIGATPVVVRPRAPLPAGSRNYVTPRGLTILREEMEVLGRERAQMEAAPNSATHASEHAALLSRINELGTRIASAEVIDPAQQPRDTVRFGATITVQTEVGETRRYQIVGVDEADPSLGLIAFVAPLARALLGSAVGDETVVRAPGGSETVTIVSIE